MEDARTKPIIRVRLREAIDALGGKTTNSALRDWVLERYPGTNINTIQTMITTYTVNHPSRVHAPEIHGPRVANDSRYDFLYRPRRSELELYDPDRHGTWSIVQRDDGSLGVEPVDSEPAELQAVEDETFSPEFAAEAHLRDYLASNLGLIEPGLSLYTDSNGTAGIEYPTPIGRIDILAVDSNQNYLIIELKVSRGPDDVAAQLLRYRSWVKRHIAKGGAVRGVIIAGHLSDRVRYALADVDGVTLYEYEMHIALRPVSRLSD
ncbi:MAG TPA: endonuclease NucS domain-containing protein [Candidatus Dormibacteraeota bacterium]|nr:endonuclease NucS domain-containing protein [Candidatus Dormibacteraeota bacterium]